MSKIDDLIKEHCPNGVAYKSIEELGNLYGGITGKSKDDFKDGNARFITYMNVFSNIAVDQNRDDYVRIQDGERQRQLEKGDILFTGSSENPDECGMSSVVTEIPSEPLYLNSFCFFFRLKDPDIFLPDFLKYLFRDTAIRKQINQTASGVTRFNISKKRFIKIKLPIPPIDVQKEIVHILDKFTQLEAELEAELEARKIQYEYYRNQLLLFGEYREDVRWLTLGDVATIKSGKNKDRKTEAEYPVFGSTGIIGYSDKYTYEGEALLVARVGAYAGQVNRVNGRYDVSDNTLIVKLVDHCSYEYFYHLLVNMNLNQYASGGGQPLVTAGKLKELQIPVPELNEQNHIAEILDKFHKLVNDISEGLPGEINARSQQYEYYRTKLLTFQELPA